MSDADDALLPCPAPWCESEVIEVVYSPWSRGYYAACQSCRCQGPSLATHAEAIAAWNRRAPDDRDATIARLREALEPFALISMEGVITADTGFVTVITQAEYFHRAARAALETGK